MLSSGHPKRFEGGCAVVNLKELSLKLGLSPTTVSRALNGFPEVNEETRAKVVEAARRHNYRPNVRARALATGRAMAIGHVIPLSSQHEIVNPVFADFIAGAGESYAAGGYDMVLTVVSDVDVPSAYRELMAKGTVDGIIVQGPSVNDQRITYLHDMRFPFVVHGRSTEVALPYSWLDVNNRRAFERATDFLLDLGHRRIALINGLEFMDFALRRRKGYEHALTQRGIAPDPALMRSEEMTEGYGYRAATAMLALPNPPTAFIASSLIPAYGIRRALEDRGLKMGRDVSVVTHDDELSYFGNGDDLPIFTCTRSSVREAGRIAARMLIDLIDTPEAGPTERLLEANLVVGLSTGPVRS